MHTSAVRGKGSKRRHEGGVEVAQTWGQVHILGARIEQKWNDEFSARYVGL